MKTKIASLLNLKILIVKLDFIDIYIKYYVYLKSTFILIKLSWNKPRIQLSLRKVSLSHCNHFLLQCQYISLSHQNCLLIKSIIISFHRSLNHKICQSESQFLKAFQTLKIIFFTLEKVDVYFEPEILKN